MSLISPYAFVADFEEQSAGPTNIVESGGTYTFTVNSADPPVANGPRAEYQANAFLLTEDVVGYHFASEIMVDPTWNPDGGGAEKCM